MTGCPAVSAFCCLGGERAGGGVGDRVEREPEREPGDDEREAAAERGRGVEDAGDEEGGGEAGDERELRESEQADPDHLAGEQVARPHRREDQLDDAVVLLLDDAGDAPTGRRRQGTTSRSREPTYATSGRGVGGLLVRRMERCRRQLRRRRQVAAERAHGGVCDRRRLRVDVRAEDEPVVATGAGARRPASASSACRPAAGEATTRSRTFASSNGFAARWSAASRPGGAGAVTATR